MDSASCLTEMIMAVSGIINTSYLLLILQAMNTQGISFGVQFLLKKKKNCNKLNIDQREKPK